MPIKLLLFEFKENSFVKQKGPLPHPPPKKKKKTMTSSIAQRWRYHPKAACVVNALPCPNAGMAQ